MHMDKMNGRGGDIRQKVATKFWKMEPGGTLRNDLGYSCLHSAKCPWGMQRQLESGLVCAGKDPEVVHELETGQGC